MIAGAALLIAFAVECSQLWHPEWLDALRADRVVGLLLGRGFLWSDLLAYVVGVLCIAGIERGLRARFNDRRPGRGSPCAKAS